MPIDKVRDIMDEAADIRAEMDEMDSVLTSSYGTKDDDLLSEIDAMMGDTTAAAATATAAPAAGTGVDRATADLLASMPAVPTGGVVVSANPMAAPAAAAGGRVAVPA